MTNPAASPQDPLEELRAEMIRLIRDMEAVALKDLADRTDISRPHLGNFMNGRRELAPEKLGEVASALRELAVEAGDLPTLREIYRTSLEEVVKTFDLRFVLGYDAPDRFHNVDIGRFFVEPRLAEFGDQDTMSFEEAISHRKILSIIGPAGIGKTTLLAHEAMLRSGSDSGPLPIYFPLNAYNRLLVESNSARPSANLLDVLSLFYEELSGVSPRALFEDAIKRGKALVLLDGLDEVARQYVRTVVDHIDKFVSLGDAALRGNTIVVTERGTTAYGRRSHVAGATVFHMCALPPEKRAALAKHWLRIAFDTPNPQKEASFLAALEDPRFADLAGNPFFLTLMTAIVVKGGAQEMFVEPSRAKVLDQFFRNILGSWNNLRSRDGRPTPIADDFTESVSELLLAHLAHCMVATSPNEQGALDISTDFGSIEAEMELAEMYRRESGPAALNEDLRTNIQAFIERCRIAGVLYADARRIAFAHNVVRDWFLAIWLSQEQANLLPHLDRVTKQPSGEYVQWEQPLAFALAAFFVVRRDLTRARRIAQEYIGVAPLDSSRLRAALPLGLEIAGSFADAAGDLHMADTVLIPDLMDFYEATDYALVTNHLQPMMVSLMHRAPAKRRAPTIRTDLDAWLVDVASEEDVKWVARVECVWRYQTDFVCLKRLVDETRARRSLTEPAREKLLRRLLFGMNFIAEFTAGAVDFLGDIAAQPEFAGSPVRAMASYTLFQQRQRLMVWHPHSGLIPQIDTIIGQAKPRKAAKQDSSWHASTIPDLIKSLATKSIRMVAERSSECLTTFRASTGLMPAECLQALVKIVEPHNNGADPERRADIRETAVALILTARLYSEPDSGLSVADLHPDRRHANVLQALLSAAEVTEVAQHESVGACQVYDFAVWALRSIFLGSSELLGLPLPTADLHSD